MKTLGATKSRDRQSFPNMPMFLHHPTHGDGLTVKNKIGFFFFLIKERGPKAYTQLT